MTDTKSTAQGPMERWLRDDYFEEFIPDRIEGTNLLRKAREWDAINADLLAALKEVRDYYCDQRLVSKVPKAGMWDRAEAAIQKAEAAQ